MPGTTITKVLGAIAVAVVAVAASTWPPAISPSPQETARAVSHEELARSQAAAMGVSAGQLWRAGRR